MAYVDCSTAHLLDEQFDGVLTAVSLCGGWVPEAELARYLGTPEAARALVTVCDERRFGHIWQPEDLLFDEDDPAAPVPMFHIRHQVEMELFGDPSGRSARGVSTSHGMRGAVHRFMYALETGRRPQALFDVAFRVMGDDASGDAMRTASRYLRRLETTFVERDPDRTGLVSIIDSHTRDLGLEQTLKALPYFARALGGPLRWRWLVGSAGEAQWARKHLGLFEAQCPVPIEREVIITGAARYLVPDRAEELGFADTVLPPPKHPGWVVARLG